MLRYVIAVIAATAMLVTGGCGEPSGSSDRPAAAQPEDTVTDSAQPSPGPGGSSRGARGGVAADAVRDLARRLDLPESAITVVSADEVTWRDGSLGCPRPGMVYPQVLTDGSRVVLEADGQRYEYHAGGRRSAFLCENPEPPARR